MGYKKTYPQAGVIGKKKSYTQSVEDKVSIGELWSKCRALDLIVSIPGHPPSVNKLYATIRGRRVKAKCGRDWESYSSYFIRQAAKAAYGTASLGVLKGRPLGLTITLLKQSWEAKSGSGLYIRPDVSNFIKSMEDSLMLALGLDDSSVVQVMARKISSEGVETSTLINLKFF